jgi:hypothetical protein
VVDGNPNLVSIIAVRRVSAKKARKYVLEDQGDHFVI